MKLKKPKLLIIGHARHGKDTVAEILAEKLDLQFTSSSLFVAKEIMWEDWGQYHYSCFEEMFADRVNNRSLWANLISEYNTPVKSRTAATMLERGNHMYVGMRRKDELEACKELKLFDHILWVDAGLRHPPEGPGSMDLAPTDADSILYNNESLKDLHNSINKFTQFLKENQYEYANSPA